VLEVPLPVGGQVEWRDKSCLVSMPNVAE
jgi:hypothetical protein